MQFQASKLAKDRKCRLDKRSCLQEAATLHTTILSLIQAYEALNDSDQLLSPDQKLKHKLELREIKLSSILLRMKCLKKLQKYPEAYVDACKLWNLMNPQERRQNAHFQSEYLAELRLLNGQVNKPS